MHDETALIKDEIEYAIQINSKMKTKLMLTKDINEETVREMFLHNDNLKILLGDMTIKKVIIVPNRLINLIV